MGILLDIAIALLNVSLAVADIMYGRHDSHNSSDAFLAWLNLAAGISFFTLIAWRLMNVRNHFPQVKWALTAFTILLTQLVIYAFVAQPAYTALAAPGLDMAPALTRQESFERLEFWSVAQFVTDMLASVFLLCAVFRRSASRTA